ncbi:MAG: hypothetical protein HY704_07700 [Gemmatimonadetes bacterium]|nr:hypothetical protein [Gemmatimonadota bacterium]
MRALRSFFYKFTVVGELMTFFWKRKLWWLMPMVFVLVFFGLLIVFGQATGVGPFIYTLF